MVGNRNRQIGISILDKTVEKAAPSIPYLGIKIMFRATLAKALITANIK